MFIMLRSIPSIDTELNNFIKYHTAMSLNAVSPRTIHMRWNSPPHPHERERKKKNKEKMISKNCITK